MTSFSSEVQLKLSYYVYRLLDPRNGQTFYVGKGKGNRVFQHALEAKQQADAVGNGISEKLQTIKELIAEGLEPIIVIHRHGMTEAEAFLAEAVLIDAYPGLSNLMAGHGSDERGPSAPKELITQYSAREMVLPKDVRIMAINVRLSYLDQDSIYEAVRCAWKASKERASRADYVLAMLRGVCRGVFVPHEWLAANRDNFPNLTESQPGRIGFIGSSADTKTAAHFLSRKLPKAMQRRKGMASPILYNYT